MSSDQLVHRLLEQVEGSHLSFVRSVGKICRHEWDWAPDQGMQSARDVVTGLVRAESKIAASFGGTAVTRAETKELATPSAAAAVLRGLRQGTLTLLKRAVPADDETATKLIQSAVSLAQLDAHALGEIVMLQRLIDPARATVSPR